MQYQLLLILLDAIAMAAYTLDVGVATFVLKQCW